MDLVLELVALAELLLDRAHLLVEVVLLLRALHLLLDAGADLALDLEHLDLGLHQREHLFEALPGGRELEQALAVLELEVEVRDDGVGEPGRRGHRRHRVEDLGRNLAVQLDVGLEGGVDRANERRHLDRAVLGVREHLDLAGVERVRPDEALDRRSRLALDEHLHGAVGKAQELQDRPERADAVDVLRPRIVDLVVLLRREQQLAVAGDRVFERLDRARPPDEERDDHVREDDDVAQREQRDRARPGGGLRSAGLRVVVFAKKRHLAPLLPGYADSASRL